MNQRRSLSQSLQTAELPPEALALIKEGSPRSIRKMSAPSSKREPEFHEVRQPVLPSVIPEPARSEDEPTAATPRGLVPLSVRVESSLADTLLRVAFERKLQRKRPYSQQDIVTQAVQQWLKRNGYTVNEGK